MGILDGGFWVEVRFEDYSSLLTYMHIYFEFWLWGAFNMFNIYMHWERNPLTTTAGKEFRLVPFTDINSDRYGVKVCIITSQNLDWE